MGNAEGNVVEQRQLSQKIGSMDVLFRTCLPEDGPSVNAFYNTLFGTNRSDAIWRWRYVEGPAVRKCPVTYVVAEVDGEQAGQYPTFARDFCVRGRDTIFYYALDTAVGEKYRKGFHFFRAMSKTSTDFSRGTGADIGFGFPNINHHKIGRKVSGYRDVTSSAQLFRRLNLYLTLRKFVPWLADALKPCLRKLFAFAFRQRIRAERAKLGGATSVETVDRFDERLDALWERRKAAFPIIGLRDSAVLNWRYVEKPENDYRRVIATRDGGQRVVGFAVLRVKTVDESLVGYFVDLFYEDQEAFDALILDSLDYFTRREVDFALCMTAPASEVSRWLGERGFKEKSFTHLIPLVFTLLDATDEAFYANPANWYLTYGDTADM
jgi:hypothetical protein